MKSNGWGVGGAMVHSLLTGGDWTEPLSPKRPKGSLSFCGALGGVGLVFVLLMGGLLAGDPPFVYVLLIKGPHVLVKPSDE